MGSHDIDELHVPAFLSFLNKYWLDYGLEAETSCQHLKRYYKNIVVIDGIHILFHFNIINQLYLSS
jgi:hypothetical protein